MDIRQFARINVLNLPVLQVGSRRDWPQRFFLYSDYHIIYVRRGLPGWFILYDSGGMSTPDFTRCFAPPYKVQFGIAYPLQRSLTSRTCAYHAVVFSLGYYSLAHDFDLEYVLGPELERLRHHIHGRRVPAIHTPVALDPDVRRALSPFRVVRLL